MEIDEYRLNSLTKFLFKKEGYLTLMKGEEKPEDLRISPCLGLTADIKDNSGMFVTKLVLQLRNCSGELVFESKEGRSRSKKYLDAYQEALKDAFESVRELNYKYNPGLKKESSTKQPEAVKITEASVDKSIPVNKKDSINTVQSKSQETGVVEVSAIPGPAIYTRNGVEYFLEVNAKGFALYQKEGTEPVALLVSAGKPGTYIYNSLAHQGIAYFKNDTFIVEYYNTSTGETITQEYQKKD